MALKARSRASTQSSRCCIEGSLAFRRPRRDESATRTISAIGLLSEAARFSHANHDIFLVTRLDGFTVEDAIELIDRAAAPAREGVFVLDQRASLLGNSVGDNWLAGAAERLSEAGLKGRVVLEESKAPVSEKAPALGYYSWGSNDPAIRARRPDVTFANGALAGMFVSTDARTFKEPPAAWTIGEWGKKADVLRGIAAVAHRRSDSRRGHRRVRARRRAVPRRQRAPADSVSGLCRGIQSRRVVLSCHAISELAERHHRRSACARRSRNPPRSFRPPSIPKRSCRRCFRSGALPCSPPTTSARRFPA